MKKSKQLPQPRNPIVMAAIMKKGGIHQKPHKSIRRSEKISLKKGNTDCFANIN